MNRHWQLNTFLFLLLPCKEAGNDVVLTILLHSNEIDTDLSMLALVVSPPFRVKFGSSRGVAPDEL